MAFFLDKNKQRKSPVALAAVGMTLVFLLLFGMLYALLAEPLYALIHFSSPTLTNAVHSLIIAVVGTGLCCLFFLLRDKRLVPYGFAGLAVVLVMFYAASFLERGDARRVLLYIISSYGLIPVLTGNLVSWTVYGRWKRSHPHANRPKTAAQSLREAVKKQNAGKTQPVKTDPPAPPAGYGEKSGASPQEEAMLLYEEEEN